MTDIDINKFFVKKIINIKVEDNPDYPLTVYFAKYNKILNSVEFNDIFKERNHLSDSDLAFLWRQFYVFNTLRKDSKTKKSNPLNKIKRKFYPETLLYYPSFNSRYGNVLKETSKKIEIEKIKNDILKKLKKVPIDKLYLDAVYERRIKNYLSSQSTFLFFEEKIKATRKLYFEYQTRKITNDELLKEADNIYKRLFNSTLGDYVRSASEKLQSIVERVYKLKKQIELVTHVTQNIKI